MNNIHVPQGRPRSTASANERTSFTMIRDEYQFYQSDLSLSEDEEKIIDIIKVSQLLFFYYHFILYANTWRQIEKKIPTHAYMNLCC